MMYIDRMLGCQDQNVYSETKKLKVLCTNTSPKCIFSCIASESEYLKLNS